MSDSSMRGRTVMMDSKRNSLPDEDGWGSSEEEDETTSTIFRGLPR